MILIDFPQIVIPEVAIYSKEAEHPINDAVIRKVEEIIVRLEQKFSKNYGRIVICCDGPHYWRQQVFPHYKHTRQESREHAPFSWNFAHEVLNELEDEILPSTYNVMKVEGAEADDIIAILSHRVIEPHIIVSSDRDFLQLQKNHLVHQYDYKNEKYLGIDEPELYLKERIIKGSWKDGIPNVRNRMDFFATKSDGQRQAPVSSKMLSEWMKVSDPKDLPREVYERWIHNNLLINMDEIPDFIRNRVESEFEKQRVTT